MTEAGSKIETVGLEENWGVMEHHWCFNLIKLWQTVKAFLDHMKNYCTPKIFLCRKVFTYIKISWFSNKDTPNKKTTIHIQKSKGKLPNEIYPKRLPFVTLDKFYLKTSMKKSTNISFVASIYVDSQIVYTKLL